MFDSRRISSLCFAGLCGVVFAAAVPATVSFAQANGQVPFVKRHIYSETADPAKDISAALAEARKEHKRVLIDFGGDWCGDCQVLDIYFRQSPNEDLLKKNFVLVHVFINAEMGNHLEIAKKYGVPISHGVPALAVLSSTGKVLYSQETGQFADMRHMSPESVTEFLNKWKG